MKNAFSLRSLQRVRFKRAQVFFFRTIYSFCGTELILSQKIWVPTEARNLKSVPYVVLAQWKKRKSIYIVQLPENKWVQI